MKKLIFAFLLLTALFTAGASALSSVEYSEAGFDAVLPSSCDVVTVLLDGKYGVVDLDGNTVVPFDYYYATSPNAEGQTVLYKLDGTDIVTEVFDRFGNLMYSSSYASNGKIVSFVSDGIILTISNVSFDEEWHVVYSVDYISLDTGKVLFGFDSLKDATPFSEGYAVVATYSVTYVINTSGEKVYTGEGEFETLALCGDGKIPFSIFDEESGTESYYIVDLEAKERICLSENDVAKDTNFKRIYSPVANIASFYSIENENMIGTLSQNGVYIYLTENPTTFDIDYTVVANGKKSENIGNIAGYNAGEKYIMAGEEGSYFYVTLDGKKVNCTYEAVTPFSDGKAAVFANDGKYVFVDENFNEISEHFDDAGSVINAGKIFYALKDGKYRFVTLSQDSIGQNVGMDNFKSVNEYNLSVFPDVKENNWFFENVSFAYEKGLMYGKENGFAPKDNLTVAQVITMAARLNSIYNTGEAEFVQGDVWYKVYVDYCISHGIIREGEYTDFNRNATRAEFVRILSASVPESEFGEKNTVSSIPDVADSETNAPIYMFYRAGILAGSDEAHTFFPDSDITRAESAAILTRIIEKKLRLSF